MKQDRLIKQDEPKHWRVRGKSRDGVTVTLGKYDTEKKAREDCETFVKEGFYRNVVVDRIAPPTNAATEPQNAPQEQ